MILLKETNMLQLGNSPCFFSVGFFYKSQTSLTSLLISHRFSTITGRYFQINGAVLKNFLVRRECSINLRSKPELFIPPAHTVLKCEKSPRYLGSVIWNSLTIEIRQDHLIF